MSPVWCVSLYIDTVDSVEHIEVIHINGPGESFQGGENVSKRHSYHLNLVTVRIEKQLRDVLCDIGRQTSELLALRSIVHKGVGSRLKLLVCRISPGFKHHGKASGRTQSRDDCRRAQVDFALRIH